jgi:hypothetical protein
MASSHRGRVKLFAQKTVVRRATKFASVAALALTAVAPSIAEVGPRAKGVTAVSGVTDISARRRQVRVPPEAQRCCRLHCRHGSNRRANYDR